MKLSIYLFLFMISGLNICYGMNYRERITEAYAEKARNNNTDGFQGCKNQAKCGFEGFYLARYTSDGLCDSCNFKEHPDRFTGCLFCRKPQEIKQSYFKPDYPLRSCMSCLKNAQELITTKLQQNNIEQSKSIESAIHQYLWYKSKTIKRDFIRDFNDRRAHGAHAKTFKYGDQDPCFYKGMYVKENGIKVHIWVSDLDITKEDRMVPMGESAESHVAYIFEKYKVFGPETGEQVLELPKNASFLYEEKI